MADFTTHTLEMTPDALNRDLSAFLDLAVDVALDHGGLIDKFIGDEVMAVWGYASDPDDGIHAFEAAVELVRRAAELTIDGRPLKIGVGLESGLVTLGVFGNADKKQFTVIGPSVNLAARLQAETRKLKVPIALGPDLGGRLPAEIRDQLVQEHVELRHIPPLDIYTFDPMKDPRQPPVPGPGRSGDRDGAHRPDGAHGLAAREGASQSCCTRSRCDPR